MNVDVDMDHPVCDPVTIEAYIEGRVEVYSPTTSGWNRPPPRCRKITCPVLEVPHGKVIYKDAEMALTSHRVYAAEADVKCEEGWIRVANDCADESGMVQYYAKPYNTGGCNHPDEEISDSGECLEAVKSLLGVTLRGSIEDKDLQDAPESPAKCSYRESDGQIMFNANSNGEAHTSLAPICKQMGDNTCEPKCIDNGQWTVKMPECKIDWCHPVHKEWSCCQNRKDIMEKSQYWLDYHKQLTGTCPIGYGDCNHDYDCYQENGVDGVCANKRDLDNIDICIIDQDPCITVNGVQNAMCCVMEAVGVSYHDKSSSGVAKRMFFSGSILAFGTLLGYFITRNRKGEEHRWLLDETF